MNLPTLPWEIINIIMSYVIKQKIYNDLIETKEKIDYVNIFYNHNISFSKYFLFKRKFLIHHKKREEMEDIK